VANVGGALWQDESGRVHTPLEPVVLAATLMLIPVLILEADADGGWLTFAYAANWVIWGVFAAELALVLYVGKRRRAALRAHWLDVAIVLLTVPLVSSALGWGRLARFVRLFRFGTIIGRALQAERRITSGDALRVTAILTLAVVVISGAAQWAFDADEFPTLWDGVWWSVVTATTVGCGDLYPRTAEGRIIGILVMMMGIAFVSLLTAARSVRTHSSIRGDVGSGRRGRADNSRPSQASLRRSPRRSSTRPASPKTHRQSRRQGQRTRMFACPLTRWPVSST
jgi:voltage-gated potassium channel